MHKFTPTINTKSILMCSFDFLQNLWLLTFLYLTKVIQRWAKVCLVPAIFHAFSRNWSGLWNLIQKVDKKADFKVMAVECLLYWHQFRLYAALLHTTLLWITAPKPIAWFIQSWHQLRPFFKFFTFSNSQNCFFFN